jgi:hypothetical protein
MGVAMTPYHHFVSELARLVRQGRQFPLGGFATPSRPAIAADAPRALIFSPHPDDECIIGGLALRLQREAGLRVVNVAVTRGTDPAHWSASVEVIARLLGEHRPAMIFFPHDADWNSSHIGTHHLLVDALARQAPAFTCRVVETEFWGAMATPNLMVESSIDDVAEMMTALSFHVGEVQRNPYHLLVPAWMQDNVRRGGERVGGQGGAAPDFDFCTLYRLREWRDGALHFVHDGGRALPASVDVRGILAAVSP